MSESRDLRVSDAEREHVAGLLQKAVGQGLITLEEFSTRTDTALAARTRGELNVVLADLPGLVHHPAKDPVRPDRLELKNTMSSTKRTGDWRVPRELVIRSRMGQTELDFTEARVPPEVRIELDVTAGSVELLVPSNASVSSDGIEVTAGSVEDKTGHGEGTGPRFTVSGTVRAGSVEIRRPRYRRYGRMVVRWPFKITWLPRS